jgi:hypothetical protein
MKSHSLLLTLGSALCFGLLAGSARADGQVFAVTATPTVTPIVSGYGYVSGVMMPGVNGAPATCYNAQGAIVPCSSLNPTATKTPKVKVRPTPHPTPIAASVRPGGVN